METINDIVAEMRCGMIPKHRHDRELLLNFADRIEAAYKREVDSIHRAMVLIAGIEMEDSENPPRLWTALEDAYDALSDAVGTDGETTADVAEAKAIGRHFVVKPSGNAAKTREALERLIKKAQHLRCGGTTDCEKCNVANACSLNKALAEAYAALSAPPRNCDVGTAEEQVARFNKFCFSYYNINNVDCTCGTCPLKENVKGICEFAWMQMPYEKDVK